jgi:DNA-binding PadR family transcriptional regulator
MRTHRRDTPALAAQRRSVLDALSNAADDPLTGRAISRLIGSSGDRVAGDDRLLYPALHGLEASGKIRAAWLPGPDGRLRRMYRMRPLWPPISGLRRLR